MVGRAAGPAVGNLTVAVTSFVGRRREIAQVRRALSASRLVTLTGVGGVGKTRLALEVATEARRAFRDGAWLVDLATVADGAAVAQTMVTALGIRDQSTRTAPDQLVDHLSGRQVLIVLDNCEHLLEACAVLVDRLLHTCPGLRVLATSRETLGIEGEHVCRVPPLSVPDPAEAETLTPAALGLYESVGLLVERAAAVLPGFAVTERNRDAVVRLCSGLDGIPLAIELAAIRLRSFSVEQVVERLEDRFGLLTGGSRAVQPRQRTLRALIDWSHGLCSEEEQRLWARLSVFAGGFDLDAAEDVCSDEKLSRAAIFDLVDHLVAQSIIVRVGTDGPPRFRMLETIRQYGRERLMENGEHDHLRERHRDYFLRFALQAAGRWCGPGQEAVLAQLRADHGNLRAALDWCLADPDRPQPALALCAALRWHWCADGFLSEGRRWLDQALALPGKPTRARSEALWVTGWVTLLQGDQDAAERRLEEARRLAEAAGDRDVMAHAASFLGTAALFRGHVRDAIAGFDEALRILHEVGNTEAALLVLFQLAIALSHAGENERAAAAARQAIDTSERSGEHWARSYALWALSFDTWVRGHPDDARRLLLAGLELQRGFRDSVGAALMIELLAWIAASKTEFTRAASLLGTTHSIWRSIGTGISAFGPQLAEHHDRCRTRTMRALPGQSFQGAFDKGVQPTVEQAIEYATGQPAAAGAGAAEQEHPELTPRELEVAELVGQGLSNRLIAERLVVSRRTVDGHMERILAKLGFTSRAQVAVWMAERPPR